MPRRLVATRPGKTLDMKQWDFLPSVNQVTAIATVISGSGLAFAIPATILRVRGYVTAAFDETKQVGDTMRIIFGLGIVSSDAFTLGATALPNPGGQAEYPWLWWGGGNLEAFVAAGEEAFGTTAFRLEVDSKAMRKVKPGQTLAWIVETAGVAGAPVTSINFGQTRVLFGT